MVESIKNGAAVSTLNGVYTKIGGTELATIGLVKLVAPSATSTSATTPAGSLNSLLAVGAAISALTILV